MGAGPARAAGGRARGRQAAAEARAQAVEVTGERLAA